MERFITDKFKDELTGLNFGLDKQGRYHLLEFLNNADELEPPKDSVYLDAFSERKWDNTTSFQTVTCDLTGDPIPLVYQVPTNKILQIDTVIAANDKSGVSLLGIFIDDELMTFFPLNTELFYSFNEKIKVEGKLEIKYRPTDRKSKLSVFVHGMEVEK